jgi:hypothetical protein
MITAAPTNIVYLVKAVNIQKGGESEPHFRSNLIGPVQEVTATPSSR